ncbi:zinc finger, CCHC-type containing protein [Tanacetum coccineum]
MRTTMVLVSTRNQNWNVGSVARLVTSRGIAVVVDAIALWIDFGATTHVCKDRCWFKTYEPVEDGSVLYMGDIISLLFMEKEVWDVVRLPDPRRKTLGEKSIDCIFVGYAEHSKAYRFYVIEPNNSVSINSIIESRDAIFDENHFTSIPRPKDGSRDQIGLQYSYCYSIEEDPKTYNEAMQSREAAFWKEAIDDEIGSIIENNTWVLSDLPQGCKLLGFRQKEGIDYFDTYAPVARITTIRLLLALAAIHNLVIHQMDAKTTFLTGDLEEEVYMKQPEGFVMPDCSPMSTPMDLVEKLKPNTGKPVDQLEYSRAIGCLMYVMTSTRPDIAYAVGTINYGLSYVGYLSVLEAYSDASWINHVEDSSSTSRWVFLLGKGAISWASKKQTCITGSTMESEFVALAAAGKETKWLRNLIYEILIWLKPIAPISIHCDSAATLAKAYSRMYNGKFRHLGVRHSMIRELIMNGVISIEFVRSQHNLADHLTKGLC